ncbi:MAG: 6-phosphogluconolactonase [Acidimicrobiia bacterium]
MILHVLEPDRWPEVVADRLDAAAHAGSTLCLPTGATPRDAYALLAAQGDLSGASIFLLDEFVLPHGSAARCDSMLRRDLLNRLTHQPERLETWDTMAPDLEAECARITDAVNGAFDVAVLGIGTNGHLGLNEPGSSEASRARVVDLHPSTQQATTAYGTGPPPEQGVTFGLADIMDAAAVWLLATGAHKASIIAEALTGAIDTNVPASVLQAHPDLHVFLDTDAASNL